MLKTFRHLLELIRFSHTLFALPFALLAAVMAWRLQFIDGNKNLQTPPVDDEQFNELLGHMVKDLGRFIDWPVIGKWQGFAIRWQEIVGILLCMVTARSFAMAFNRLADRRIDATNPRTAGRHLPAGLLSVPQVTVFAGLCAAGFVASTLLFLPNRLPLMLSIPVLAFLAGYSFTKRFTSLAHFWLGTALALSPIAAWIAIRGESVLAHPIDLLPALVLGGAVLAWVAGFDIIYACQDYDVDVTCRPPQHSRATRNSTERSRLAAACHMATIALLICFAVRVSVLGWIYWAGVAAVAGIARLRAFTRPS